MDNFTGAGAPTANDDVNRGYNAGSRWIDVTTGSEYVCQSGTSGSALWVLNYASGPKTVAGLNAALGLTQTPSRSVLIERFEQKPYLAGAIDPATPADPSQAEIDVIFAANRNFEVAGMNMTSALSTLNVARMGGRLTTAGATNDQAILQPRTNPSGVSRWSLGFSSNLSPTWKTSFRLDSVSLITFKAALALTNAHDLTTDADQVGLWLDTSETDSVVDNPNFQLITSIGGTDVAVDTGIEAQAGVEYELAIEINAARVAKVTLNGVVLPLTGALSASKTLLPFLSIEDISAGVAKVLDYRYQMAAMNNA